MTETMFKHQLHGNLTKPLLLPLKVKFVVIGIS